MTRTPRSRPVHAEWTEQVRKVLLAGVGAVALAQEEIEDFVHRLVERGGMARNDARKVVKDVLASRTAQLNQATASLEHDFQARIEKLLHRMKFVSRQDLNKLSSRIEDLESKVQRLHN